MQSLKDLSLFLTKGTGASQGETLKRIKSLVPPIHLVPSDIELSILKLCQKATQWQEDISYILEKDPSFFLRKRTKAPQGETLRLVKSLVPLVLLVTSDMELSILKLC